MDPTPYSEDGAAEQFLAALEQDIAAPAGQRCAPSTAGAHWPLPADPGAHADRRPAPGLAVRGAVPVATALSRLSAMVLRAGTPADVYDLAVDTVGTLLGVDFVVLWQVLPGGLELAPACQRGWPSRAVSRGGERVVMEQGSVSALALATGTPVVVEDIRTDPRFRFPDASPAVGHVVLGGATVPVGGEGEPWGALGVHLLAPRRLGDDEVDLIRVVADLVATAAEREQVRRHRAQSEQLRRLSDLGRAAAGVAHDVANVLCGIDILASDIEVEAGDRIPETSRHLLRRVHEEVGTGHEIVHQVFEIIKAKRLVDAEVDVCGLVRSLPARLGPLVGPEARVVVACPEEPLVVRGDRGRLLQVFTNLVTNAVDAMGGAGEVRIEVTSAPGPWVCVAVRDTGVGIPAGALEDVFQPFFTSKARSTGGPSVLGGSGLGLAQVRDLVEQHRGHVILASREGAGTTVTVWLPPAPSAVPRGVAGAAGGTMREGN